MTEKKNKGGRPTKYRQEYCEGIVKYFEDFDFHEDVPTVKSMDEDGNEKSKIEQKVKRPPSLTKYASSIGVDVETFYNWKKKFPKFKRAFDRAKKIYLDIYIDGAMMGMYNPFFTKLVMMNRFAWNDKQEIGGGKTPVSLIISKEDQEL